MIFFFEDAFLLDHDLPKIMALSSRPGLMFNHETLKIPNSGEDNNLKTKKGKKYVLTNLSLRDK
jgi:hypothetical protein